MKNFWIRFLAILIFINFIFLQPIFQTLVFAEVSVLAEETAPESIKQEEAKPVVDVETPKETKEASEGAEEKAGESEAKTVEPVIEIKRLPEEVLLYSFELRDAEIADVFRILAHDFNLNLLIDNEVQGKITASLMKVSLEEALEAIADLQNLTLERKGNTIKVSPNLVTVTLNLKYIEAKRLLIPALAQQSLGASVAKTLTGSSSSATAASLASQAAASATQVKTGPTSTKTASSIYDLLSEKGKVLLGAQPNSIMVIDYLANVKSIEDYIKMVDQKIAQRVFKLKYLKASEILGRGTQAQSSTSTSGTSTSTTGSTSK